MAVNTQFHLPHTPSTNTISTRAPPSSSASTIVGDGFTPTELHDALDHLLPPTPSASSTASADSWHPSQPYQETALADLQPGSRPVTFIGRIANIYDVAHTPKTNRAARGCVKLCVKDDEAAVTVRLWYNSQLPALRLGSLISVWTNHVSNGEQGSLSTLSSTCAPLFTSIFPERDRNCRLHVYEYQDDDRTMFRRPLGYEPGLPPHNLMTLRNFIDGGHEVAGARVMLVVKQVGTRKKVTRQDGSKVENINIIVQDDIAQAVLGFWGKVAYSPGGLDHESNGQYIDSDALSVEQPWKPNETILLLQSPNFKAGSTTYLSLTSSTIVDVDPDIPETTSLRRWAKREQSRANINPTFPQNNVAFSLRHLVNSPVRCCYTLAELDDFARVGPSPTKHASTTTNIHGRQLNQASYQGYLNLIITRLHLLECTTQNALYAAQCCDNPPIYTNGPILTQTNNQCPSCSSAVPLRLNPGILGAAMDETAVIARGHFLLHDSAWRDLLGGAPANVSAWSREEMNAWETQWRFRRVIVAFGWTGDETVVGGRICVLGIDARFY